MPIEKIQILAQVQHYRSARPKRFWAAAGVAGASMFGMVMGAFGTASDTNTLQISQSTVVEQLASPQAALLNNEANPIPFVREERILRGDTVASLLGRLGADDPAAINFLLTHDTARVITRQMSPGKTVTAQMGEQGELLSLVFPLNGGKDQALFIERQSDDGFKAFERNFEAYAQFAA